jgi:SAM-dependent methyltransferase
MSGADTLRARNHTFWTQAAPGWIRHADRQDEVGRPLGAAAMDWLRPEPGERILDVGCGGTTAELAAAVGSGGAAVGVDLAGAAYRATGPGRGPGGDRPAVRTVPRAWCRLPLSRRDLAGHRGGRTMITKSSDT